MAQIIGEKTHAQPGFVGREPLAACLDPAQRIFTLLDPIFDIAPPVLTLTHGKCGESRIGYNEKVSVAKRHLASQKREENNATL